jgi:hypothetical protein
MSALRAFLTPSLLTGLAGSILLTGCVDPGKRLTDFEGAVVDGGSTDLPDGQALDEIPDIGGTWYVVFKPVPTPDIPIHTVWTVDFTRVGEDSATVAVVSNPLNKDTRVVIPAPFELTESAVNKAGEFTLEGTAMPLPNGSSALPQDIAVDLKLSVRIKSKDFMCGVMTEGRVVDPEVPLNGSTFGAQRVAPGTQGNDLPAAITECPPDLPDAGVPDAPVADIDAATPDAGVDAAVDAGE